MVQRESSMFCDKKIHKYTQRHRSQHGSAVAFFKNEKQHHKISLLISNVSSKLPNQLSNCDEKKWPSTHKLSELKKTPSGVTVGLALDKHQALTHNLKI